MRKIIKLIYYYLLIFLKILFACRRLFTNKSDKKQIQKIDDKILKYKMLTDKILVEIKLRRKISRV